MPSSTTSNSSDSPSPTSQRQKLPQSNHSTSKRRRADKDGSQYKALYPLQRGSACLSCRYATGSTSLPLERNRALIRSHMRCLGNERWSVFFCWLSLAVLSKRGIYLFSFVFLEMRCRKTSMRSMRQSQSRYRL